MRLLRSPVCLLLLAALLAACKSEQSSRTTPLPVTVVPTIHPQTATATHTPVPTLTPTLDPLASDLPLESLAYVLPLTIRHLTPTSATLFFELAQPVDGVLFYQSVELAQSGRVPLSAEETRHQVVLEGLMPDTIYQVKVGAQTEQNTWVEPSFQEGRWGPVILHTPSDAGTLRFGVIGDASFGDPVTAALVEQMAAANLDFVLHTGDVVDETDANADPFASYARKYYATFAPLLRQMPVYTVMGNHDYDADIRWQGEPFYFNAFPPFDDPAIPSTGRNQYYAFSFQGLQFLMLDSQVLFGAPGRKEQEAWLAERLADPRFRVTLAVLHVSPYSSSSVHPTECLRVREIWAPILEAARVTLVFSGHTHQYERLLANGTTYIVSGGGSATLYARGELLPESQLFARISHYVLVEVDADSFEVTARSVTGEEIDRTSIPIR